MEPLNVILSSQDESNVSNRDGELAIRLPQPLNIGQTGRISLEKLIIGHARKGLILVTLDEADARVLSDGKEVSILGVYHGNGSKLQTYSFPASSILLPIRSKTLSSLTLRVSDPLTGSPVTFHKGHKPLIIAHLQINQ